MIKQYQSDFQKLIHRNNDQPEYFRSLRQSAFDRFLKLGFPTTKTEGWRFTNISNLSKTKFSIPDGNGQGVSLDDLADIRLKNSQKIVILNGRFCPELSDIEESNNALVIQPLSQIIHTMPELIIPHLNQQADQSYNSFAALNTAFLNDGLFLQIKADQYIEEPIHLLFVTDPNVQNQVNHYRNIIHLENNSQATIIEHNIGIPDTLYFTNVVTKATLQKNSHLNFIKLQQESSCAYHIANTEFHQHPDSQLKYCSFNVGGKLARNDCRVILNGEGAESNLNGLTLSDNNQQADNHIIMEHSAPHCRSRQIFKNVLKGNAHGVFNGLVTVHPEAQKTDATQTNKNLLLSSQALMNSNPQLEINTDDVKCSHSSTTGELDEDALFYLQSRGIDYQLAQTLLVQGFTNEIIAQISFHPLREKLNQILNKWLTD